MYESTALSLQQQLAAPKIPPMDPRCQLSVFIITFTTSSTPVYSSFIFHHLFLVLSGFVSRAYPRLPIYSSHHDAQIAHARMCYAVSTGEAGAGGDSARYCSNECARFASRGYSCACIHGNFRHPRSKQACWCKVFQINGLCAIKCASVGAVKAASLSTA